MRDMKTILIETDAVSRQRLSDVIRPAKGIHLLQVFGEIDQSEILAALKDYETDVVLLGIAKVESPEMDLFEKIRDQFPMLPVIVLPIHNEEGARATLKALKKGAVEYVNKTMSFSGAVHNEEHFRKRLVPVIKAVPRLNKGVIGYQRDIEKIIQNIKKAESSPDPETMIRKELLVLVGCLGGVPALYLLLSSLPKDLPVPIVVVQHMPKIFTRVLADDLQQLTGLEVMEAADNTKLEAGKVYIAPGDQHAHVHSYETHKLITLNNGTNVNGYRPSIDELLRSSKNAFGNRVLVVYLSGGGTDGIEGAEVLDTVGGQIIIQNKNTSLLWDLPFKVDVREVVDGSFPVDNLGYQITQRLK